MRTMELALAAALLAACGGRQNTSAVSADDAIITFAANVRDANLFVDGKFIGPVGVLKGGIAIEPGKHRFELRHEDYFSAYIEVDAKRAEKKKLEITLAPILP
jgi:hypothetical protein